MKKNFKYYTLGWSVAFVAFNMYYLLKPRLSSTIEYTTSFWICYASIFMSFIGQFICTWLAFKKDSKEKIFLNLSMVQLSFVSLTGTISTAAIYSFNPLLPTKVCVFAMIAFLATNIIEVIKVYTAISVISEIEDNVKRDTYFIKELTMDVQNLVNKTSNEEIKSGLLKIYEKVRYSDPMSKPELTEIEEKIRISYNKLVNTVENESQLFNEISKEMLYLIDERNTKCRLLK